MGYYVMNCIAFDPEYGDYTWHDKEDVLALNAALLERAILDVFDEDDREWSGHEDALMRSLTGPHEGPKGAIMTAGSVFNYTNYEDVCLRLSAVLGRYRDVFWMGEFDGNGFRSAHFKNGRLMTPGDY